jgi:Putative Ig domain
MSSLGTTRACLTLAGLLVLLLVLACAAGARPDAAVRVTVFGDSAATAMAYDPTAKRTLGRGIDLRLEVAACRRVGDASCPYDGVRPPNVIERATELGAQLGPVVVVIVGYNDYEANYAANIEQALGAFRTAGVQEVVWLTLRESRQSYASMNDTIREAARRHPELTVVDWNALSRARSDWFQPDGIHLTAAGAEGMADLVNGALVELGVAPKRGPATGPLAISSTTLPVGHRGRTYSVRLTATGGAAPYRWNRLGGPLPPGLRLSATGRLAGVPARVGTFRVRARVVDRSGSARARVFSLKIA